MAQTFGLALNLQDDPEKIATYRRFHQAVWPEVLEGIRHAGITKYVIFRDGLDLFHFIECDNYDAAIAELALSPINQRWEEEMAPMTTVAHDFTGQGSDRMRQIFEL